MMMIGGEEIDLCHESNQWSGIVGDVVSPAIGEVTTYSKQVPTNQAHPSMNNKKKDALNCHQPLITKVISGELLLTYYCFCHLIDHHPQVAIVVPTITTSTNPNTP